MADFADVAAVLIRWVQAADAVTCPSGSVGRGRRGPGRIVKIGVDAAIAMALLSATVGSSIGQSELDYQEQLCRGMPINRHLPNGTEVDCISTTHAIEVDFSRKWAEAIGQSLMYASVLEKRPGIILICPTDESATTCLRHRYLVEQTVSYWRIGMTLWLCEGDATMLDDCLHEEICNAEPASICDSHPRD